MADETPPIVASTTRREFTRAAIVAVTAPVLAPLAACAASAHAAPSPAPAASGNASPSPVAAPASPAAPSAPPQGNRQQPDPRAVHLTEALRAKYGTRLTDTEWDEVRQGVEGNLRAAKALHDFPLPMQTEPACVFRAYRGGER